MSLAEISIAPVQPAPSAAGSDGAEYDTASAPSSAKASFADVLQAAQQGSELKASVSNGAKPTASQTKFAPYSGAPELNAGNSAVAIMPFPGKAQAATDGKQGVHPPIKTGLDQTDPPVATEPGVAKTTSTSTVPDVSGTFAEKKNTAQLNGDALTASATQQRNGTSPARSKSDNSVPETAEQELSTTNDVHSVPAHSQADGHKREKAQAVKSGPAAIATTVGAADVDQPVAGQPVPSQSVPQVIAAALPQPIVADASGVKEIPQGKAIKAAAVPAANKTPVQPASLSEAKQQDTLPNSSSQSRSGQAGRDTSESESHTVAAKSEAHPGRSNDLLTATQAQAATSPRGDGASFSLSLENSLTHDRNTADSTPATSSGLRASTSSDSLVQTAPATSPVQRLEIAVQDPVLGTVGVHAEMRSGVLHASLSGTQEAIGASLSGLHHYLQDQRIAVSTLSFSTSSDRVNGTGTAHGASESMRDGTGGNASASPDRQGQREPRERGASTSEAMNSGTERTRGSAIGTSLRGQVIHPPAGSTLSIHI